MAANSPIAKGLISTFIILWLKLLCCLLHQMQHGQITQFVQPGRDVAFSSYWQSQLNERSLGLLHTDDIIDEAHNLFMDILRPLIGKYQRSMLFGIMDYGNKGDAAIQVGQYNILKRLNISINYYCEVFPKPCSNEEWQEADNIARKYNQSDLVMLSSGGGHFGPYPKHDKMRLKVLNRFPSHKFVLLSASASLANEAQYNAIRSEYPKHKSTLMFRDIPSYNTVLHDMGNINVSTVLAPDMALGIGRIPRFIQPSYDVVWMSRAEVEPLPGKGLAWRAENLGPMIPHFPPNVTVFKEDWVKTQSPRGTNLIEQMYLLTYTGMYCLQRGRVLVTDRLHGHIVAILLDIPTVIVDTSNQKCSNFYFTWTRGMQKVRLATDSAQASEMALELLHLYGRGHHNVKLPSAKTL